MTASTLRALEPTGDASLDRPSELAEALGQGAQALGQGAEAALDRLRGRPPRPALAWFVGAAAIVGLAIVIGAAAMSWARTRGAALRPDSLESLDRMSEPGALDGPDLGASADLPPARGHATGMTAAEDALLGYDPVEGRDA
ncbi:MAG: hypothetical protein L0227_11785 [Chloroflexi bacterium]|nr:hypothetical protein [Chloroflexota bacterium]